MGFAWHPRRTGSKESQLLLKQPVSVLPLQLCTPATAQPPWKENTPFPGVLDVNLDQKTSMASWGASILDRLGVCLCGGDMPAGLLRKSSGNDARIDDAALVSSMSDMI